MGRAITPLTLTKIKTAQPKEKLLALEVFPTISLVKAYNVTL